MAQTVEGMKFGILIGDGATPENFVRSCLANAGDRGLQFESDTNEIIVPDCNNPTDPAWKRVMKDGFKCSITGSGALVVTDSKYWFEWFNSNDGKNVRMEFIDVPAADGGGYWEGSFKLTSYSINGSRNDLAQVEFTLVSDGPVAWVDAA